MSTLEQLLPPDLYKDVAEVRTSFTLGPMKTAGLVTFKGRLFPPQFSPETMDYLMDEWTMREGDVLLASYAKTGEKVFMRCLMSGKIDGDFSFIHPFLCESFPL